MALFTFVSNAIFIFVLGLGVITFQEMLKRLAQFWEEQGCIIHQGYDLETGAGTFNPATFLRGLGPEPYNAFYFEPCRRPTDGRYGTNPNRVQHYFQGQLIMKPSPQNIVDLCLRSLEAIGFALDLHDIRLINDDWESPTLGAWGLGWEIWMDGMEVAQFTYFQSLGGIALKPVTAEITYGLERLALYLQKKNNIFDLKYNETLNYGDIYYNNEVQWSQYNFEHADVAMWTRHFEDYENEARSLLNRELPIPAYDFVLKASHAFNLLDARGVISVTERTGYISRIRQLACLIAESYVDSRAKLGYPLLHRFPTVELPAAHSLPLAAELREGDPEKKGDFLLEIGSEELPASFLPIGMANLKKAMQELLDGEAISYEEIDVESTPRRLAVMVKRLAYGKAPQVVERRGPSLTNAYTSGGEPTAAAMGFFRALGHPPVSRTALSDGSQNVVSIVRIKGSDYLMGKLTLPGSATAELFSQKLPALIASLEFPKKMRWGDLDISYARPLRWLVCLFDREIVPFALGDLVSGRISYGHRQRDPKPFSIADAKDYIDLMSSHCVMVSTEKRRNSIESQLTALEAEIGGSAIARDHVVSQLVHMSELPELTASTFDSAFLAIPKEVLISEMVEHQKYFPIAHREGSLMNAFVITADTTPTEQIRHGNQKVLSSRLSDGAFLYNQGLKTPLSQYNEKLKQVTFQKELGTSYQKVLRIKKHALYLHEVLKVGDREKVERAAELSKADLATEMVFEFPELQGTIGRYYALEQGEDAEVAQAIEEQWMPRRERGPLPKSSCGIILSMADKIDNLIGCFSVGLKPSSSSDPYGLRRQALGMIKIAINAQSHLPLQQAFSACLTHFPQPLPRGDADLVMEIFSFIIHRIKAVFVDYGFRKDEIEAALSYGSDDIYDIFRRVEALHIFRKKEGLFAPLHEVFKRVKGQLSSHQSDSFDAAALQEEAEVQLYSELVRSEPLFLQALADKNYTKAYALLAELHPPLARLFAEVKVLADDLTVRSNRLALLQKVFNRFEALLDFNKIQS